MPIEWENTLSIHDGHLYVAVRSLALNQTFVLDMEEMFDREVCKRLIAAVLSMRDNLSIQTENLADSFPGINLRQAY